MKKNEKLIPQTKIGFAATYGRMKSATLTGFSHCGNQPSADGPKTNGTWGPHAGQSDEIIDFTFKANDALQHKNDEIWKWQNGDILKYNI